MKTRLAVLHQMHLERPYTTSKPLKIEEVILDEKQLDCVIQICL